MNNLDTVRLTVPKQGLDQSSFFDSDEAAVNAWVAKLPMTNVGQTTRMLFQALTELNTVRLVPAKRMAMLEQLRTPIYYISNALSKHFLNQPIVLPKKSRKVAALDFEIHQLLATGYLLVVTHSIALASGNNKTEKIQIASALHRVITEHSRNIQRQTQLYEPIISNSWRDLHQFYSLARQQDVLNHMVDDQEFGRCTVEESYIRVLLFGCSKPNQLRQDDLERLFKPATAWAAHCTLEVGADDSDSLFIVDLLDDKPAIYRELHKSPTGPQLIGLNTQQLSEHLSQIRQDTDPDKLNISIDNCLISNDLLSHLIVAWSLTANRSLIRLVSNSQLELCIGLNTTHHFLSNEANFESLVDEPGGTAYSVQNENRFMETKANPIRPKDLWDSPYEANLEKSDAALKSIDYQVRNSKKTTPAVANKYSSYPVTVMNSSENGYCIEIPDETGAQVKAGEIIGTRETGTDNWVTAVIRWVSHSSDEKTQMGIELICANASPFGGRIMAKTGGRKEYMRVILLPEITTTNQPNTLLTPRFPFRSGQKLTLNQYGKRRQIKLGKKLNRTGTYNQFEIQEVAILRQQIDENNADNGGFDSLWNQL